MASCERPVIIDHLAFSCPIGALNYLDMATRVGVKGEGFRVEDNFSWARMPKRDWHLCKSDAARQKRIDAYQSKARAVLETRLTQFLQKVLGVQLRPMRGRGLHGYLDSAEMFSPCGINLGLFAIGGNQDTFYCQFSGDGCRYLFDIVARHRANQRTLTPRRLYFWLHDVLGVTTLSRCDLAVDDYDGNFGCKYAKTCYMEGAFRRSNRGLNPIFEHKVVQQDTANGLQVVNEGVIVGSRKSNVYWRVYNKALEQGLKDVVWFRNEVELKKVTIDVLKNPAAHFSGICAFAASIEPTEGMSIKRITKDTGLSLAGRTRWARRQCGKIIYELIQKHNFDTDSVFGLLMSDEYVELLNQEMPSRLAIPATYTHLLNLNGE
ncbi:replication initiation factor domain-containing protein [Enterovibrio paralichthyis]|uniref:replication initiation factor domain-containing protein n=1 Tax=Enterovibrio paralichthyis TaxID=2853805 RepID=UPI001C4845C1|nr:replication initiation factor domain-containing protein [Enterovibrio paralichthyis]MBV7296611.1 replication initiation factor domain-containing protein [Enterovibrio paralichthyis]